jgi:hypothetical protein
MMTKVYVKLFQRDGQTLLAACDNNLLGETFREGKLRLEVKSDFYGGNVVPLATAINLLKNADVANLVGPRLVDAAIAAGLVDPRAVIRIGGVPHVQLVRL